MSKLFRLMLAAALIGGSAMPAFAQNSAGQTTGTNVPAAGAGVTPAPDAPSSAIGTGTGHTSSGNKSGGHTAGAGANTGGSTGTGGSSSTAAAPSSAIGSPSAGGSSRIGSSPAHQTTTTSTRAR